MQCKLMGTTSTSFAGSRPSQRWSAVKVTRAAAGCGGLGGGRQEASRDVIQFGDDDGATVDIPRVMLATALDGRPPRLRVTVCGCRLPAMKVR